MVEFEVSRIWKIESLIVRVSRDLRIIFSIIWRPFRNFVETITKFSED